MKIAIADLINDDIHPAPYGHPENGDRLSGIIPTLIDSDIATKIDFIEIYSNPDEILTSVHTQEYIGYIKSVSENSGGMIDSDTYINPGTYQAAYNMAGAAVGAADLIMGGQYKRISIIGRPPGHHALADRGMGFCIFNNIAIAAESFISMHSLKRVAIVDWDVHHGNGTQSIFYDRNDVLFISLHRFPFYPGSGAEFESGAGIGEGYTINVPLPSGTDDDNYLKEFNNKIISNLDDFKPNAILVSAGFDAHRDDPLGGLNLSSGVFAKLTAKLVKVADKHSDGRILSMVEGGYNPSANARCMYNHIKEMVTD